MASIDKILEEYGTTKSSFNKTNIKEVPTIQDLINILKSYSFKKNTGHWERAAIGILIGTGCRVGELSHIKKNDIKIFDMNRSEIVDDDIAIDRIKYIRFNLYTEKNRKKNSRIVGLVNNDLFYPLFPYIINYWKMIRVNDFLFPQRRQSINNAIKKSFGIDYYPCYLRHIAVTNDIRAGINIKTSKEKYGWTSSRPFDIYVNMKEEDIIDEQEKIYGKTNSSPVPKLQKVELIYPKVIKKSITKEPIDNSLMSI